MDIRKPTQTLTLSPNFGSFKWEESNKLAYKAEMQKPAVITKVTQLLNSNDNCETLLKETEKIMIEAAKGSAKLKTGSSRPHKTKKVAPKKWFDTECYNTRKQLRSIQNAMRRDPTNPHIRGQFFVICKKYRRMMKTKRREYKDYLLNSLSELECSNPKLFWKTLDKLKDSDRHRQDEDIKNIGADEWYEHFKSLSLKKFEDKSFDDELYSFEERSTQDEFTTLDTRFSMQEIKMAIRKLKNNKANGSDLISNEMLKLGINQLTPIIQKLFNMTLESGQFPKEWNKSYQVPIHKSGEKTECGNYRGISICSCFGKLFTSVMQKRLLDYLETENKLSKFQAAFRKGYGTNDHIFSLRSLINKYVFASKEKLYACFVDFRRAFPSVWREAMLLKTLRLGIGGKFYRIIKSMYQGDCCQVKLPDGITPPFKPDIGIKQGDGLSPLLFCIFLDDIVDYIDTTTDAPQLANQNVNCLMYADDLVLLSKTETGMQTMLEKLNRYCETWHLEINKKKTKIMIFNKSSNKSKQDNYNFCLGNHKLNLCCEYTYLGIKFTRLGNLKEAAIQLKEKAQKAWFAVRSILNSNKIHKPNLWLKLFDTMVKPILTYGGETWIQDFTNAMDF